MHTYEMNQPMEVKASPRAQRDMDKLRGATWERVREALLTLAHTPRPKECVKLSTGAWRIRIGDIRVLYDIDDKARTVEVLRIKHRRDIYRQVWRAGMH
jgi:mRNA interferase RelE/StbE